MDKKLSASGASPLSLDPIGALSRDPVTGSRFPWQILDPPLTVATVVSDGYYAGACDVMNT